MATPQQEPGTSRTPRGPLNLKPFLKWLGGKRTLAPKILEAIPWFVTRYHEPMVGAGAVFWLVRTHFPHLPCYISDKNERLIRTYKALKNDVESVIEKLSSYPCNKDFFLDLRATPIDEEEDYKVAAWLIFLNRTCYNGLYRVNRKGQFNAPWGKYKNPTICNRSLLRRCSELLQGVEIEHADFDYTLERAKVGDFVYFDPPYLPETPDGFSSYTAGGFHLKDHQRLADIAIRLRKKGVFILISNSNTAMTSEIYDDRFHREIVITRRSISSKVKSRGKTTELLLW